jgi:hypothetical protein
MWSDKRLANAFNGGMNYNVASDGKRAVVFMPANAPKAQNARTTLTFSKTSLTNCGGRCRRGNNVIPQ